MRVIAGKARSLKLKTVPGMDVRPTTDRTKETLFNILAARIPDCRFLDLFSGSGAIGIEALSRGAEKAVLVDQSRESLQCIRDNIKSTRLEQGAEVLACDAVSAIGRLEQRGEQFDIIFMDPPYNKELERAVLLRLDSSSILEPETLIVVEASLETDFSYLEHTAFAIVREKKYKTNQHILIERK